LPDWLEPGPIPFPQFERLAWWQNESQLSL
jgi:hypothetical protein